MIPIARTGRRRPLSVLLLCCLPLAASAQAQQRPLTGQMLGTPAPAPAPAATDTGDVAPATPRSDPPHDAPRDPRHVAAPAAPREPPHARRHGGDPGLGQVARALLELQADPARPGNRLPVLGDQAAASYERYLRSFGHEIPEFFETTVPQGRQNAR